MNTETIELSKIRRDGGTQIRAFIYDYTIADYKEEMEAGTLFPPIDVFYDGTDYWLADGFHRVEAAIQAGKADITAVVVAGTRRDAILHAVAANNHHGLRRGAPDKRRAVETLLKDEEWGKWSDREIARRCKVSHTFVAGLRPSVTGNVASENGERTYTTKHGTEATMEMPTYVPVWQLQRAITDWLQSRSLATPGERLAALLDLKEGATVVWDMMIPALPTPYRKRDVIQAINNLIDINRQDIARQQTQAAETAVMNTDNIGNEGKEEADRDSRQDRRHYIDNFLVPRVRAFMMRYTDEHGRSWRDIENPSHTNGIFWQRLTKELKSGNVQYQENSLKIAIKQAYEIELNYVAYQEKQAAVTFQVGNSVKVIKGGWAEKIGKVLEVRSSPPGVLIECQMEVSYPDKPSEIKPLSVWVEPGWIRAIPDTAVGKSERIQAVENTSVFAAVKILRDRGYTVDHRNPTNPDTEHDELKCWSINGGEPISKNEVWAIVRSVRNREQPPTALPDDPDTAEIRANATAWLLQLKILGWVREKITIGTEQQTVTELQLDLLNAIQNGDTGGFYWRNQLFASLPQHDTETLDVALSDAKIVLRGRIHQEKQAAEWRETAESRPVVVEPAKARPMLGKFPYLADHFDEAKNRLMRIVTTFAEGDERGKRMLRCYQEVEAIEKELKQEAK